MITTSALRFIIFAGLVYDVLSTCYCLGGIAYTMFDVFGYVIILAGVEEAGWFLLVADGVFGFRFYSARGVCNGVYVAEIEPVVVIY